MAMVSWATGAFICWTVAVSRPAAACHVTRSALPGDLARWGGSDPQYPDFVLRLRSGPIIFELRGLPKDKSFLNSTRPDSWGKDAMDTYLGISVGKVIHCENGYVVGSTASHAAYDLQGEKLHVRADHT